MLTREQAQEIALGLLEVELADDDVPSFRVRGKVFATVPDATHLNVMLAEDEVPIAIAMNTSALAELRSRARMSGVTIDLSRASRPLVRDLLEQAWRRRAPKMLVHELDNR